MKAKEWTSRFVERIAELNAAPTGGPLKQDPTITSIRAGLITQCVEMMFKRTSSFVYLGPRQLQAIREAALPWNGVRHSLSLAGINPDDLGIYNGGFFQDEIERLCDKISAASDKGEVGRYDVERLYGLIDTMTWRDNAEMLAYVDQTRDYVMQKPERRIVDFLDLAEEVETLRAKIPNGTITRLEVNRLIGVERYVYLHKDDVIGTFHDLFPSSPVFQSKDLILKKIASASAKRTPSEITVVAKPDKTKPQAPKAKGNKPQGKHSHAGKKFHKKPNQAGSTQQNVRDYLDDPHNGIPQDAKTRSAVRGNMNKEAVRAQTSA